MPRLLTLNWGVWVYGLVAGFIGGGSSAATGALAITILDPKDFNFADAKIWKAMALMFLFNGVKDTLLYLKQHPLPEVITTVTTETTTRQTDPPAIVKTTVEEKTVGTVELPKQ